MSKSKSTAGQKPQSTFRRQGEKTHASKSAGGRGKTQSVVPSKLSAKTVGTKTSTQPTKTSSVNTNNVLAMMFKATVEELRERGLVAVSAYGVDGIANVLKIELDLAKWNIDMTLKSGSSNSPHKQ